MTALLGARFAILNPHCVARRRKPGRPHAAPHVVVALGGGPRRQAAVRLATMIRHRTPGVRVSVAGGFVGLDSSVTGNGFHWVSPSSLGPTLASATIAVVGGGLTLYEAAALGVPTVAVAVVPSQRATVEEFAVRGAAVDGGLLKSGSGQRRVLAALSEEVTRLLQDPVSRRRLGRTAGTLIDASGAARVARAIRGLLTRRDGRAASR